MIQTDKTSHRLSDPRRTLSQLFRRSNLTRVSMVTIIGLVAFQVRAQSPVVRPPKALDMDPTSVFARQSDDMLASSNPVDQKRMRALNEMRRKAMASDVDKLLLLALELNQKGDSLSQAEQLKKASEIQKLAKDVKEKMMLTTGSDRPLQNPFNVWPQ